jgi:hypothetical protein
MKKIALTFLMVVFSVSAYAADARWQDPHNWKLVKPRMSIKQVEAILGKPTRVENLIVTVTYFYEGPVSGSGEVSGNVGFFKGQVQPSDINPPYFFQQQ